MENVISCGVGSLDLCLVRGEGCACSDEGCHHRDRRMLITLTRGSPPPLVQNSHEKSPSVCRRWSSFGEQLGIRWRRCEEQLRTPNFDRTMRWRAAGGTYLINMFGLNPVLLKSMHFEKAGGHRAAEAQRLACRRAAAACLVCTSNSAELGHVLGTHDEGSVRTRVRVRS